MLIVRKMGINYSKRASFMIQHEQIAGERSRSSRGQVGAGSGGEWGGVSH